MPAPYVKKLAKKHGTSTKTAEGKWDKAKAATPPGKGYGYTTQIFKNMMGEKKTAGLVINAKARLLAVSKDDVVRDAFEHLKRSSGGHVDPEILHDQLIGTIWAMHGELFNNEAEVEDMVTDFLKHHQG